MEKERLIAVSMIITADGRTDGPIQVLMHKFDNTLQITCIDKEGIRKLRSNHRLQKSLRSVKGHGIYALLLAHIAKETGYDTVAMYRDGDREQGTRPKNEHACRTRYDELKKQIETGFEYSGCGLKSIAIIPMKMIESWLIADSHCFTEAFGGEQKEFVSHPELSWGDKDDPHSPHPKCLMRAALDYYGQVANREVFCELAKYANISEIARKCPISFPNFRSQMNALVHTNL